MSMRTRHLERTLTILACCALVGVGCSSKGQGVGPDAAGATGGLHAGSGGTQTPGSGGQGGAGGTTSGAGGDASGGATALLGGSRTGGTAGGGGAVTSGGGAGGGGAGGGVATGGSAGLGGVATGGVATGGIATGGIASGGAGAKTDGSASGGATGTDGGGGTEPVHLAWTNPLLAKRADPHVFLHSDGYYYLTATVPEYDRIELRRATSLGGLSTATSKVVWRKHATGEMGAHIWAPEIHFIDGAWHIYFTAGRADDVWAIRMYVLKNASANPLEGDWTELGRIATNWDSFSLDATTFVNAGQRYYLWTQTVPDYPGTSIVIARMSSPTKLTGPQVVLTSPQYSWEKVGYEVNEGPAALVKNGKVFIAYSASATDQNYCMGLLTADAGADLLDPKSWKKSAQPVLQSSSQNSQYGPGHNSFTTTPDGRVDILVYHARNYRDIVGDPLNNPDRATRAQYLPFDAAGNPVFGVPVADGPYQVDVAP
jgi:GH43 family beta-xylosidase